MRPQIFKRRRSVALVRRSLRLEVVYPDLGGSVHWPAQFREEERHMATFAVGLAAVDPLTPTEAVFCSDGICMGFEFVQ